MTTENLLADTPTGRTDRTVVVGGHLDSVAEGPGINDNGSGTATILETALQMAELGIEPENRVRFAFWSGEEDGLIGSSYYVSQLSKKDIKGTALNLNFDMVGSPNAVNFVYDGDGDALGVSGPNGSGMIEGVFTDFFAVAGRADRADRLRRPERLLRLHRGGHPGGRPVHGRRGHQVGGAGRDLRRHRRRAVRPLLPRRVRRHRPTSTSDTLDLMADAVAHSTLMFAETTSAVNGTGKGKAVGQIDWQFKGNRALR